MQSIIQNNFFDFYDKLEFNKRNIYQIHISTALLHFSRIKKIYNLSDYTEKKNPLLVFGVYNFNDLKVIKEHESQIYILWGGTDADNRVERSRFFVQNIKNLPNVLHFAISENMFQRLREYNVPSEKINIMLIDLNLFHPIEKYGSCIYIYNGYSKGNEWIYGKNVYTEVINKLPQFKFIFSNELNGLPNEKMSDIYKKCFIGLRLTTNDGVACTVQEFIRMNIPIIHNGEYKSSIKWKNSNDIVDTILSIYESFNKERKIILSENSISDQISNSISSQIYKYDPNLIIKKKFTVIMPTYNNRSSIMRAIESVINQTYENWELLIVDDFSNDGTFEFVTQYLNNNKSIKNKIKIFRTYRNFGPYVCMNFGITMSDGEYITRIDSDDYFHIDKLKKQAEILINEDVIGCLTHQQKEKYVRIGEITLAYKRSVISKMGFYDNVRFAADSEFLHRMQRVYNSNQIIKIGDILYYYLPRENSLTTSLETGTNGKGGRIRVLYLMNYQKWHNESKDLYINFNINNTSREYLKKNRPFPLSDDILLP